MEGPGIHPKEVAQGLYDFLRTKLEAPRPIDDVMYWRDHEDRHRFALCGSSLTLFDAFGGFEGIWDNSHGRLETALASAVRMPRQIVESSLTLERSSRSSSLPIDRSDYLRLLRKWIRRAIRSNDVLIHLMPDAKHRADGMVAFSGKRGRSWNSTDRLCDRMSLSQSILRLSMPGDDRAWAYRPEDPPLFAVGDVTSLLEDMREAKAIPPMSIEYGFELTLKRDVYLLLDPWFVQSRYEAPHFESHGPWPVTLWSEPVQVDDVPCMRSIIRAQRNAEIDAAEVPWVYTAGVPRPRNLHPEWQSLFKIIKSLRRRRIEEESYVLRGFSNAYLDSNVVRGVICHTSKTKEVTETMKQLYWSGSVIEYTERSDSMRRRIAKTIETRFKPAMFREPEDPNDPASQLQRTRYGYTPLPWLRT